MKKQPKGSGWAIWLGLGLGLLIFSRISFVLGSAYHEGEILTFRPINDVQRIEAAKAKIRRALANTCGASFENITISRAAGSPAVCGTVAFKGPHGTLRTRPFVVKDGDMFFNRNEATTHDMWVVACTPRRA